MNVERDGGGQCAGREEAKDASLVVPYMERKRWRMARGEGAKSRVSREMEGSMRVGG